MVYFLKGYLTEKGEKRVERIEIEATHLWIYPIYWFDCGIRELFYTIIKQN